MEKVWGGGRGCEELGKQPRSSDTLQLSRDWVQRLILFLQHTSTRILGVPGGLTSSSAIFGDSPVMSLLGPTEWTFVELGGKEKSKVDLPVSGPGFLASYSRMKLRCIQVAN